jgi:hypothetical protein
MNRFKKVKFFLTLVLVGFILFSCNEEEIDLNKFALQNENFVSIEKAIEIGKVFNNPITNNINNSDAVKSSNKERKNKNIESITEITDESDITICYIINYENGGFVIISADNRLNPILAYSESNTFVADENNYPIGLRNWFDDTKNGIKKIRELNLPQEPEIEQIWDDFYGITAPPLDEGGDEGEGEGEGEGDDYDDSDVCQTIHIHKEPLLSTLWYQEDGFNALAPLKTSGQCLAGCVAVAMGQVMKYWEYPENYTWGNMPNTYATLETAQLLLDIGVAVDMNWGTISSYASPTEIASSFKEDFGYSNAIFANYNHITVEYELSKNRPVILGAMQSATAGGHAWVCDGYVRSRYCNGASYLVLHMNWGEIDGEFNGYFNYDNWYFNIYELNYDRKMITYIIP